jgi:peptidoglycan/LPS O-acetylase OafA/YrhL
VGSTPAKPSGAGPDPRRASISHVPALDGLRGAALLGVLFFHADGALKGGYLGVDLFFVLSGYLITSILLAEHDATGKIVLSTFWVRRARRLFPALLSLMPAVAAYAWLLARADELKGIRADALATLGYVANWRAIFSHKSYWELLAAPSPLEHTWSLAIEEQFYVVWPLLVVLVLVVWNGGRRALLGVTLGLAALSIGAMVVLFDPVKTSRAYLGTDARAAAILVGAALAMVLSPGTRLGRTAARGLDALGFVALLGLGVAWARLDGQSPFLYHGGFWLTELGCLVLIACAVTEPAGIVARVFSWRPLTWVGTISYGLYLWHWPVNVVLTPERVHVGPVPLNLLRFALTFAISIVSYRFLERPIRTRGLPFGRPAYVVPAAVFLCVLLVVRATFARRLPPPLLPQAGSHEPSSWLSFGQKWPSPYSVDSHTLPPASELKPGTLRLLTLGDSVAIFLGVALRYRQEEANVFVAERGVGDCSILSNLPEAYFGEKKPGDSNSCSAEWVEDARALHPDVTLVVLGGAYFGRLHIGGALVDSCQDAWRQAFERQLDRLLDAMSPDAGKVILVLVPYPLGRWRSEGLLEKVDCFNATLAHAAKVRGLATIDLKGHVCPTEACTLLSDGEPIRPDGLHFDGVGAEESARWTLAEVRRVTDVDRDGGAPR